ncbi:uncharacterized protein LOC125722587 isoform X2 [Brienomyrus brachyistius]|uniref:uncharacterized protein LOC125722582 isoform X2 n=1 Tax=Brienomyrus brachyistius TaxID=42636 RepID=UPI0020B213DC|nr:uncharacterized protein LOC125722582 isoform X2 [Brienomyrus brachyistius]XP_048854727.1 uncharacterized protein LOC125722586 isoform X2 [Brienomyrus brachyistius]XP_048854729.1 uncharacterized protein LOC125722587 isoform X2 [Brienomyrus brachyistius]
MSIVKTTVNLQRIDWLLPTGAVSVRIAPEYIPGPVGRGQTSSSDAGRRKKCRTRPPAASSLTTSASPGSAAIPVATSRGQQGTGRRRKTAGGRSGRRRSRSDVAQQLLLEAPDPRWDIGDVLGALERAKDRRTFSCIWSCFIP